MANLGAYQEPQDEGGGFDPLPAGDYLAAIAGEKSKRAGPNAKLPGRPMIDFEFEVMDGPAKGRRFWDTIMFMDPPGGGDPVPDPTIPGGRRQLDAIIMATGKLPSSVSATEQLHGIPMIVRLKVDAATASFPAKNRVVSYRHANGAAPAAQTQAEGRPAVPGGVKRGPWA